MPYLKRNVTQRVRAALADTPVVALNGPRQVGTTTLARGLAFPGSTDYLSLDDESLRKSARLNPLEFLERGATLSSLTRSSSSRGSSVPSSCLSIAIAAPAVFSSPVPVDCSQHPIWPTPLVGRVETIELSPFTQGEVEDRTDQFIDLVFGDRKAVFGTSELRRADYVERLVVGGFPDAVARSLPRRKRWFTAYTATALQRAIAQLADIERAAEIPRILALCAARTATGGTCQAD